MGYHAQPNPVELKNVQLYFQSKSSYWNDVYEHLDLKSRIYRDRMDLALQWIAALDLSRGERLLDEGCGAGLASIALAQQGYNVQAMDTAEAMVEFTQRHAVEKDLKHRISTCVGDAHHLDFEDSTFSLVLALGVIPWLVQPAVAIREMARVLKPGGYLLASSDNRLGLHCLLDPRFNDALALPRRAMRKLRRLCSRNSGQPGPVAPVPKYHRYSIGRLDGWLASAGLEKVKNATLGFGPFTFFKRRVLDESTGFKLHQRLQYFADRDVPGIRSMGRHYLVLARKPKTGR